jgi:hypothetical protein
MTDPEREHFIHEIRDLERARGRWRLAALVLSATSLLLCTVLCLPIALGGLLGVAYVPRWERDRAVLEEERARALEAEMRAREAAEEARQEAEKAKGTGKH